MSDRGLNRHRAFATRAGHGNSGQLSPKEALEHDLRERMHYISGMTVERALRILQKIDAGGIHGMGIEAERDIKSFRQRIEEVTGYRPPMKGLRNQPSPVIPPPEESAASPMAPKYSDGVWRTWSMEQKLAFVDEVDALREVQPDTPLSKICRPLGVPVHDYNNWKFLPRTVRSGDTTSEPVADERNTVEMVGEAPDGVTMQRLRTENSSTWDDDLKRAFVTFILYLQEMNVRGAVKRTCAEFSVAEPTYFVWRKKFFGRSSTRDYIETPDEGAEVASHPKDFMRSLTSILRQSNILSIEDRLLRNACKVVKDRLLELMARKRVPQSRHIEMAPLASRSPQAALPPPPPSPPPPSENSDSESLPREAKIDDPPPSMSHEENLQKHHDAMIYAINLMTGHTVTSARAAMEDALKFIAQKATQKAGSVAALTRKPRHQVETDMSDTMIEALASFDPSRDGQLRQAMSAVTESFALRVESSDGADIAERFAPRVNALVSAAASEYDVPLAQLKAVAHWECKHIADYFSLSELHQEFWAFAWPKIEERLSQECSASTERGRTETVTFPSELVLLANIECTKKYAMPQSQEQRDNFLRWGLETYGFASAADDSREYIELAAMEHLPLVHALAKTHHGRNKDSFPLSRWMRKATQALCEALWQYDPGEDANVHAYLQRHIEGALTELGRVSAARSAPR